jgi:hypothetical protein
MLSFITNSLRRIIRLLCLLLFSFLLFQCEKEPLVEKTPPVAPLTHSDSLVIAKLPRYYKFLVKMKEDGYTFMDFRTYMHTDTSRLPQKLIVIRHDVHFRDIYYAYYAFKIEQLVIGSGHSTYFIMINDPVELKVINAGMKNEYMKLIHFLDSCDADIQPHISAIDLYISNKHPYWERYSKDSLKRMFDHNYYWDINKTGRKLIVTGKDVFDINDINRSLISLMVKYNEEWTNETNLEVQGYASHGSGTPMNLVMNNAYILDQTTLLMLGLYKYDTYNSRIFNILTYLSDNNLPSWMINPSSIPFDRYQFLMHPYQWAAGRIGMAGVGYEEELYME